MDKKTEQFKWIDPTGKAIPFEASQKIEIFTRKDIQSLMDIAYQQGYSNGLIKAQPVIDQQCAALKEEINELTLSLQVANQGLDILYGSEKELKEEIENLKRDPLEIFGFVIEHENKRLKEENERLKGQVRTEVSVRDALQESLQVSLTEASKDKARIKELESLNSGHCINCDRHVDSFVSMGKFCPYCYCEQ